MIGIVNGIVEIAARTAFAGKIIAFTAVAVSNQAV